MSVAKVTVRIKRPNLDILQSGMYGAGALYRIERSTDSGVSFSEITTGAVVSGVYSYLYYDATSASGYQYRSRYSKATPLFSTDYSEYSAVVQV